MKLTIAAILATHSQGKHPAKGRTLAGLFAKADAGMAAQAAAILAAGGEGRPRHGVCFHAGLLR